MMFGRRFLTLCISVAGGCLLGGCLPAAAVQTPGQSTVASDLDGNYKDRVVKLETPYCGQKLRFDATAALVSGGEPGDWTKCQVLRIQHVAVQNGELIVAAQRVLVPADWATGHCAAGPKPETAPKASTQASSDDGPTNGEQVVIEIELPPRSGSATAMGLMDKVFPMLNGPVFGLGSDVSPPVPVFQPDPQYSKEAQDARYEGKVVLTIFVGPDGKVYRPKVFRPLGMGLDEKAVDAVLTWRFKPATRCGVPVAVQVSVEVDFHLTR